MLSATRHKIMRPPSVKYEIALNPAAGIRLSVCVNGSSPAIVCTEKIESNSSCIDFHVRSRRKKLVGVSLVKRRPVRHRNHTYPPTRGSQFTLINCTVNTSGQITRLRGSGLLLRNCRALPWFVLDFIFRRAGAQRSKQQQNRHNQKNNQ